MESITQQIQANLVGDVRIYGENKPLTQFITPQGSAVLRKRLEDGVIRAYAEGIEWFEKIWWKEAIAPLVQRNSIALLPVAIEQLAGDSKWLFDPEEVCQHYALSLTPNQRAVLPELMNTIAKELYSSSHYVLESRQWGPLRFWPKTVEASNTELDQNEPYQKLLEQIPSLLVAFELAYQKRFMA